ncbi:Cloroperoxidase [Mycena metata]|uniref:Cloroperoxidase n=1 Tax=Mycena metata TaxID=1033252 RepID=A0AAD7H999_9AGAR|nr:Cloroperoxidase [Mycena metata]
MNLFKLSLLQALLLAVSGGVIATYSSSSSSDNNVWIAPGPTDVRSPCPGLNTLANHGYLPRSGKNISVPMIAEAMLDGFNIVSEALTQAAKFGLLSSFALATMDLDALKLHSLIEHDASLSRGDFALGDNLHFNETIFSSLLNSNPGVDYYNATSAGHVMHDRLAISLATNPNTTNTPKEFAFRTRESSLYLAVMGNPLTGVAPKQFVEIFFREERLPIAEGWKRSNTSITDEALGAIDNIIMANSNWTFTQMCEDLVLGPGLTV